MTVVVGVAAPDGMVLAAESRTTYYAEKERDDEHVERHHRIASDTTQKVFALCDSTAVATYGDAFVGPRTVAGLMDEFASQLPAERATDAAALAAELGAFFDGRYRAENDPDVVAAYEENVVFPLGFLVAGYDDDGIGRIREVAIPGPYVQDEPEITTATLGVLWRGQTQVIRRLVKGVDLDQLMRLGYEVPAELEPGLQALAYNLLYPITLQDAIDFADFLIRTTIDMQRFSDGTFGEENEIPGCGGAIRSAVVTRGGIEWINEVRLVAATRPGLAEGGPLG